MSSIKEVVKVKSVINTNNNIWIYSFQPVKDTDLINLFIISMPHQIRNWETDEIILLDLMDYEVDYNNKVVYVIDYEFQSLGVYEDCHTFFDEYNNEDIVIHKMEFPDTTHFRIIGDNGRERAYHVGEWANNKQLYESIRNWLIEQNTIHHAMEGHL